MIVYYSQIIFVFFGIAVFFGVVNSVVMRRRFHASSPRDLFLQGFFTAASSALLPALVLLSLKILLLPHANPVGLLFVLPPVLSILVFGSPVLLYTMWARRALGQTTKVIPIGFGLIVGMVVIAAHFVFRPSNRGVVQATLGSFNFSHEQGWVSLGGYSNPVIGEHVEVDTYIYNHFPHDAVQPAHIHAGTCDAPGDMLFNLQNVKRETSRGDGSAFTWINRSFNEITAHGSLMVEVHVSQQDPTRVACGELLTEAERKHRFSRPPTKFLRGEEIGFDNEVIFVDDERQIVFHTQYGCADWYRIEQVSPRKKEDIAGYAVYLPKAPDHNAAPLYFALVYLPPSQDLGGLIEKNSDVVMSVNGSKKFAIRADNISSREFVHLNNLPANCGLSFVFIGPQE